MKTTRNKHLSRGIVALMAMTVTISSAVSVSAYADEIPEVKTAAEAQAEASVLSTAEETQKSVSENTVEGIAGSNESSETAGTGSSEAVSTGELAVEADASAGETASASEIASAGETATAATEQVEGETVEEGTSNTAAKANTDASTGSTDKDDEDTPNAEKYIVSYLNADGVIEFTRTYEEGEDVDLSLRLGGGENQLGWSLEDGGESLSTYTMKAADVSLYPVLDARAAEYTVYYETENASGGYDVIDTVTVNAVEEIGNTVSADDIQSSDRAKNYTGYEYSAADSTGAQTISDGSKLEIHVRFNAKEYHVTFDLNGNKNSVGSLYYSTLRMNMGGTEYTGTGYSADVKAGADFSAQWPTADNIVDNPYLTTQYSTYFRGWTDASGTLYTDAGQFMAMLPSLADADGNVTLSARWAAPTDTSGAPEVTIKYNIYHENVEKDGYDLVESLDKTARASAMSSIYLDPYEGFTYSHAESVGEQTSVTYGPWYAETTVTYYAENNVYFDRNEYPLIFVSEGETIRSESVAHGADLSAYSDYEPDKKPVGRTYLEGWLDEDGVLFDFSTQMPMESVTLTASWKYSNLEIATLTYDANGGTGSIDEMTAAVDAMVRIADSAALQREGYTFKEWNTEADGSGTSYNAGEIYVLEEDATLYAIWEKDEEPSPEPTPDPEEPKDNSDDTKPADKTDSKDNTKTDKNTSQKSTSSSTKKSASSTTKNSASPETGDYANATAYIVVLMGALAAGITALVIRRKVK